jgi:hypothetical protein
MMQRIAVLLLCSLAGSNYAQADACENVAGVVSGFAGGATGYGLIRTLGPASSWVGAGLYGAGIAAASIATRSTVLTNCDGFFQSLYRIGEIYCEYSTYDYDCRPVSQMTRSIAADFAMCPGCTFDEVMGAFFLVDDVRESYLRGMQQSRWGRLASRARVIRRDHLGRFDASVVNSYYQGLQAGFALLNSRVIYTMMK